MKLKGLCGLERSGAEAAKPFSCSMETARWRHCTEWTGGGDWGEGQVRMLTGYSKNIMRYWSKWQSVFLEKAATDSLRREFMDLLLGGKHTHLIFQGWCVVRGLRGSGVKRNGWISNPLPQRRDNCTVKLVVLSRVTWKKWQCEGGWLGSVAYTRT